jgi:manganese transport protein
MFTSSRKKMGEFVNAYWLQALAWLVAVLIAGLNGWLLLETMLTF